MVDPSRLELNGSLRRGEQYPAGLGPRWSTIVPSLLESQGGHGKQLTLTIEWRPLYDILVGQCKLTLSNPH